MAGPDDIDCSANKSVSAGSVLDRFFSFNSTSADSSKKSFSFSRFDRSGSVKKLCNLFEPAKNLDSVKGNVKKVSNFFGWNGENSNSDFNSNLSSPKPFLRRSPEESRIAETDLNAKLTSRWSFSPRQLGFNQSRIGRSVGPVARVSSVLDNRIRLPGTEDRIVLYFTSLRGIRRTYEDCCAVRLIFRGLRTPVDERDISMDSKYRKELQSALGEKTVSLPQVFIRGKYVGGADEIKQLHEVGELVKLLEGFPLRATGLVCESCGDVRFIPCLNCNGSRKVFDEDEGQLQRCPECNENGLIRCPYCCS